MRTMTRDGGAAYKLSETSSSVLGIMGKGGEKHAVKVSHAVNI